eukprot:CAMPEP_0172176848 /NCGR_PEP_ID=MMETSP1050-20130122/15075_1 /TAXON_ID=233186 /ORGANISM="Cryptomonas curvata, Strain CCAP979/52" /LENGTH=105 /DNA_ID=CAMNT_0012849235 /DNA_START=236 /DNA_END=550 /DNA_ORIENTATION=+
MISIPFRIQRGGGGGDCGVKASASGGGGGDGALPPLTSLSLQPPPSIHSHRHRPRRGGVAAGPRRAGPGRAGFSTLFAAAGVAPGASAAPGRCRAAACAVPRARR